MMLKLKFIVGFLLCFALNGKTQYIVFDSVYTFNAATVNQDVDYFNGVVIGKGNYFGDFTTVNYSPYRTFSSLIKTNNYGEVVVKKKITFNQSKWYLSSVGVTLLNKNIVFAGVEYDTISSLYNTFLYKTDTVSLDSIKYSSFAPVFDYSQIAQLIYDSINNYIYGVGYCNVQSSYSDVFVLKADTSLNVLWKNKYGLSNRNEGGITIELIRSDTLFVGGLSNEGSNGASGIALLLDTAGNQQWMRYIDIPGKENVFGGGYKCADGGYLMPGTQYIAPNGDGNLAITKLDVNGIRQWDKLYSLGSKNEGTDYCFFDPYDSTIIAVGGNNNVPQYHEAGLAVKYTMQGDTVWARTYDKSYNKNGYIDHFYTGHAANDGGYLFAGQTSSGIVDGKQDAWLLKTDSIACHPNYPCWPATHYDYSGIKENVYSSLNLTVFPNPANSYVCIRFKNSYQNNACTLRLYNSSGQLVKEEKQIFSAPLVTIKTEDLPQGLYLLEVETTYGKERVKIIKE